MKFLSIICCFFILLSCTETSNDTKMAKRMSLKWLVGDWVRINNSEGKITYEKWEKISKKEYKGIGYTLNNVDTLFKEDLRIIVIDGNWSYEVSGVHEKPINFEFTQQTKTSFVSENDKNPFPKIISYQLKNDTLIANISAGNDQIDFIFKKELP